jgi:flavin reductase (DIM6/NTAB) family NADH-FMN oxidoreductase RutF
MRAPKKQAEIAKTEQPAATQPSVDNKSYFKILAPRTTVLVTTTDPKGRPDVSPFSFVSPVSFDPPLLMIAVGLNKHSYWNIMQKKEFVVNIPTESMLDKIWVAGEKWDSEVSKIERAGFKTEKSERVSPPWLSECVASMECYVEDAKKYGDHIIIIGKVEKIHVNQEFLDEEGRLKADLVRNPLHISDNVFAFPYVIKKA